ncbi:hypothetical protein KV205_24425 [Streptomyces sp. SKN60]|uniref:hypothetical protein n=1 Tax=Streptomyces sp. SKN60 TaxID=2855506 RepID=UPI002247A2A5|nr:hypothetical protein [Streptomyces sp. SKN60]MCX2183650.1 hypothetical protein [Streptomyces sp. SKN60]
MLAVWGLLLAVGIALTVWGPGLVVALAGVVVRFVASGGFVTDRQTLAGTAAPELRATSSAWLTSTMYAGTGIGAWAVGALRRPVAEHGADRCGVRGGHGARWPAGQRAAAPWHGGRRCGGRAGERLSRSGSARWVTTGVPHPL